MMIFNDKVNFTEFIFIGLFLTFFKILFFYFYHGTRHHLLKIINFIIKNFSKTMFMQTIVFTTERILKS